ncbi:MAG TPA: c-type cytochrome domain-containing protein [Vicinamibacteria bacterium]|nr:c-type cytochrome domain-containing protein [Vicinamibacteria bacterium]
MTPPLLLAVLLAGAASAALQAAGPATVAPDFDRAVLPVLEEHCTSCHSAADPQGDLVLETYEDVKRGGEHGPALTPGDSEKSRLVMMVEGRAKPKMPPKKDLPADALAVVKAWIDAGAPAPAASAAAIVPDIKPRVPRPAPVYALAFAPDGKTLAVAGHKEVRLIDLSTGTIARTLLGASDTVRAVAFSPDGKTLAGGGGPPARGGETVLWNAETGEEIRRVEGHRDFVYAAAFSPNGRFLATGSYDRGIRLWSPATGRERGRLREHLDAVFALGFSPDGRWLASGSGDRTVKVWDVAEGRRLFTLADALDNVYAVAFHPGGRLLAAGGADKVLRAWNVTPEGGTLAFATIAHEEPIVALAFSPDGKRLVTAGADRVVKVWDVEKRTELRLLDGQTDWPMAVAIAADGARLAVGRYDGSVGVYDLESGRGQGDLLRPRLGGGSAR